MAAQLIEYVAKRGATVDHCVCCIIASMNKLHFHNKPSGLAAQPFTGCTGFNVMVAACRSQYSKLRILSSKGPTSDDLPGAMNAMQGNLVAPSSNPPKEDENQDDDEEAKSQESQEADDEEEEGWYDELMGRIVEKEAENWKREIDDDDKEVEEVEGKGEETQAFGSQAPSDSREAVDSRPVNLDETAQNGR